MNLASGVNVKRWWLLCLIVSMSAAAHAQPTILVFGDSISAGYGIEPGRGWVALLQDRLRRLGYGYQVVNASVSGETTAGGLDRLPRALELHHPDIVILELGGNDGLRALPIPTMRDNLARMVRLARDSHAAVLLLGMRIPPNYGPRYSSDFAQSFTELAQTDRLPLVPFLMQGIALDPRLMQADGIHPNERGQPLLLTNVWKALRPLLRHRARSPTR
ncbi:MAG: arylesterase [Gammaproteobacteria bacterium]|nr:arylesterase [Gammaproteobacteria bacterium]